METDEPEMMQGTKPSTAPQGRPVDPNRIGHKKTPASLEQMRTFHQEAVKLRSFVTGGWKPHNEVEQSMIKNNGFGRVQAAPGHSGSGWAVPGRNGTHGWNPFQ